ncbi:MAG: hypothetical protein LBF85_06960 [Tannerella sp.]|jgi:hypothetical protein|nr:hypothetical protein [Tannerella sp.]
MCAFIPKSITERELLKIRYPKGDCFCEWQEQMSITEDMEIIISTDEHDREPDSSDHPNDPFFGHYNTYL